MGENSQFSEFLKTFLTKPAVPPFFRRWVGFNSKYPSKSALLNKQKSGVIFKKNHKNMTFHIRERP